MSLAAFYRLKPTRSFMPSLPVDDSKQLRQRIRRQRRDLTPQQQQAHSLAVALRLARSPLFMHSRRIAAYISADGEIDPMPLLVHAFASGKRCFLPVLRAHPQRTLWFCELRPRDTLLTNRYGIAEPNMRKRPPVPPWGLDLILLPLVAFDTQGNRLGMGGGFYDRTLGYLRHRRHWRSPKLIGIAHECQKVERLAVNHWDIPLQGVVTESAFYRWE